MAPRPYADSEETFERILDAALNELRISHPPQSLSMRGVSQRAGVSLGTLYYYFNSKQALLDACADRRNQDLDARLGLMLNHSLRAAGSSTALGVESLVRTIYRFLHAERDAFVAGLDGAVGLGVRAIRVYIAADMPSAPKGTASDFRLARQALACCISHFALRQPEPTISLAVQEDFLVQTAKRLLAPDVTG